MKIINLFGQIDSWLINDIIRDLQVNVNQNEDIEIKINSIGGEVFAGFTFYNFLKSWKGTVTTVIMGQACSIAGIIYLAGTKKRVFKSSLLMFHKASSYTSGNAEQLKKESEILKQVDNILIDTVSEKTGLQKKEINKLLDNEWYLIGGENIKQNGLADEIIDETHNFLLNYINLNTKEKVNMTKELEEKIEKLEAENKKLKAALEKEESEEEKKKKEKEKEDLEKKLIENSLEILEIAGIDLLPEIKEAIAQKQNKETFAYNLIKSKKYAVKRDNTQEIKGLNLIGTNPKTKLEEISDELINQITKTWEVK